MERSMGRGGVQGDDGTFIIIFLLATGREGKSKLFPMFFFFFLADMIIPSQEIHEPTHTHTQSISVDLKQISRDMLAYCCLSSSFFKFSFQNFRLCRQYSCSSVSAASVSVLPWRSYSSSVRNFFLTFILNRR